MTNKRNPTPSGDLKVNAPSGVAHGYYLIPMMTDGNCYVCQKPYTSAQRLRDHHKIKHFPKPTFKCPCGETFLDYRTGTTHYNKGKCGIPSVPRRSNTPKVQCEHCPAMFETKRGLSQHVRHMHQNIWLAAKMGNSGPAKANSKSDEIDAKRDRPSGVNVGKPIKDNPNSSTADITADTSDHQEMIAKTAIEQGSVQQLGPKKKSNKDKTTKAVFVVEEKRKDPGIPAQDLAEAGPSDEINKKWEFGDPALPEKRLPNGGSPPDTQPDYDPEFSQKQWEQVGWETVERILSELEPADQELSNFRDGLLAVVRGRDRCKDLTKKLDEWIVKLTESIQKHYNIGPVADNSRATRRNRDAVGRNERRMDRRQKYAETQKLYRRAPARLADAVVKGTDPLARPSRSDMPAARDLKNLYDDLWGKSGNFQLPLKSAEKNREPPELLTEEQVHRRIATHRGGAPGLDGITANHLRRKGTTGLLAAYMNALLLTSHYPTCWKQGRTILIPKDGTDLTRAANWRPLTISSYLGRVFSGLLEVRLSEQVELHPRQKGFVKGQGCAYNCLMLDRMAKRYRKSEGYMAVLDISKAFDTVPHAAIHPVMEHYGVNKTLTTIVGKMYTGSSTTFRPPDPEGLPWTSKLSRGVKQGDPLSPLLFNLVMDPLLRRLNEHCQEWNNGPGDMAKPMALGYADDLVLLCSSAEVLRKMLKVVEDYLKLLDMSLSPLKCRAIGWKANHGTWAPSDPLLNYNGVKIPLLAADETIKYLGVQFGYRGIDSGATIELIKQALRRVNSLKLKPAQKLDLLQTYILPKFNHALSITLPSGNVLNELDLLLRKVLKEITHLHHSATDGILHCRKKDGGLGFPRFDQATHMGHLGILAEIRRSDDVVLQAIVMDDVSLRTIERLTAKYDLAWPATRTELAKARLALKTDELERWSALPMQGRGVKAFRDSPISNRWLYDQKLLKPHWFLQALKFRTNTAPVKVVMAHVRPTDDVSCRRCSTAVNKPHETLGHILGQCPYTKDMWVHRHDEVVQKLGRCLSGRARTMLSIEETIILTNGTALKPDLVVFNEAKKEVAVVDVAVRMEEYLQEAAEEKVRKYQCLKETLMRRHSAEKFVVRPITLGARGCVPIETAKHLRALEVPGRFYAPMVLGCLQSSMCMFSAFMDGSIVRVRRR